MKMKYHPILLYFIGQFLAHAKILESNAVTQKFYKMKEQMHDKACKGMACLRLYKALPYSRTTYTQTEIQTHTHTYTQKHTQTYTRTHTNEVN